MSVLIGCKTLKPFSSSVEKRKSLRIIKNELQLSSTEYDTLKDDNSLLYEVTHSISNKVNSKLIERRIDSLILGNYSKQELLICLKIDRISNGWNFEFDRSGKSKNYPNFNNIDEVDAFLKKVEKSLSKQIKVKIDSTKR